MQTPLDRGRLRNAGVSDVGIDFIAKMLRLDPNQRPTELECLQHPWITDRANGKDLDLEMKDVDELLGAIEEDPELDASQLSITENSEHFEIGDSDEERDTDDDQHQSKRIKSHHQPILQVPARSSSEDETVSHNSRPGYEEAAINTNRLFGEIGASALRSSGVLDHDAHEALDMTFDRRVKTTSHALAQPQPSTNPQSLPGQLFVAPAPSLFGAESLVGQLDMASLKTGTPASSPDNMIAKTAASDEPNTDSPRSATGLSGSKHSIETGAPKRAKKDRLHDVSPSSRELKDPTTRSYGSQTSEDSHGKKRKSSKKAKLGPSVITNVETTANETGTNAKEPSKVNATSASIESPDQLAEPKPCSSGESSTAASVTNDTANEAAFSRPPTRLGMLTSMPGSFCNVTIKLEQRLTYYGRDPSSHVQHADIKDARIPRNALDVVFWRPGIEAQIANGQKWEEFEDIYAILLTRTSRYIKVNGTKLTHGEGCWNFGRLYTGDVITVFGPAEEEEPEGKAEEFLRFRCEFFVGASAKLRDENNPFVVEKEEEKYALHQARLSSQASQSNPASQGSHSSSRSGDKRQNTTTKQGET